MLAGGMESMSNAPYLLLRARSGYRFGDGERSTQPPATDCATPGAAS